MITGILGKKIGMTQIFNSRGMRISVTLLQAGPCVVQNIRTSDKNGYTAIQLGYSDAKEKHVRKPQLGYLKSKNLSPKKFVREIRCQDIADVKIGDTVTNSIFQKGDYLDVVGTSKGKGYQGGVKRCGWLGGCETHGSMSHRAPGSIGASSFPSKVDRGHGFPGHMGSERVTVQNLKVVDVDTERNTIAVNGAVPGANDSFVLIRFAKKKKIAQRGVVVEDEAPDAVEEKAQGSGAKKTEKKAKEEKKKDAKGKK